MSNRHIPDAALQRRQQTLKGLGQLYLLVGLSEWCIALASLHWNSLLLKLLELVRMGLAIFFSVCLTCLRMTTHKKLVAIGCTLELLEKILTSAPKQIRMQKRAQPQRGHNWNHDHLRSKPHLSKRLGLIALVKEKRDAILKWKFQVCRDAYFAEHQKVYKQMDICIHRYMYWEMY